MSYTSNCAFPSTINGEPATKIYLFLSQTDPEIRFLNILRDCITVIYYVVILYFSQDNNISL